MSFLYRDICQIMIWKVVLILQILVGYFLKIDYQLLLLLRWIISDFFLNLKLRSNLGSNSASHYTQPCFWLLFPRARFLLQRRNKINIISSLFLLHIAQITFHARFGETFLKSWIISFQMWRCIYSCRLLILIYKAVKLRKSQKFKFPFIFPFGFFVIWNISASNPRLAINSSTILGEIRFFLARRS